jgi:hypothetical protein
MYPVFTTGNIDLTVQQARERILNRGYPSISPQLVDRLAHALAGLEAFAAGLPPAQLPEGVVTARQPAQPTAPADDDENFVPANQLMGNRFDTLTQMSRFLDDNKQTIRQKRKGRRRRVHAGDWFRHWAEVDKLQFKALDDPAMSGYLGQTTKRLEAERRRKDKGAEAKDSHKRES